MRTRLETIGTGFETIGAGLETMVNYFETIGTSFETTGTDLKPYEPVSHHWNLVGLQISSAVPGRFLWFHIRITEPN